MVNNHPKCTNARKVMCHNNALVSDSLVYHVRRCEEMNAVTTNISLKEVKRSDKTLDG